MTRRAEDHAHAENYRVSDRTIRLWRTLGAPLDDPSAMPAWIKQRREAHAAAPRPPRTNVDCRQMAPEQKQAHRAAQRKASYTRTLADPIRHADRKAADRARWVKRHGPSKRVDLSALTPEQRQARKREQEKASRERRKLVPEVRAALRQREHQRQPYKHQWRRDHAADLNARHRAARLADPAHFRALEASAKKRRRETKKAKKTAGNP